MAGNFWKSSHYGQWIISEERVLEGHERDSKSLSVDDVKKLHIFFANFIQALGETNKLRQQVIATATVYFKRFYILNSFKSIDPFLMAPTCIFLASKVEECGPIPIQRLITVCSSLIKSKFNFAMTNDFLYRPQHVLECEFYLLEMMDCCLIVHQPYRPLTTYSESLGPEVLNTAWHIINDTLRCDVILTHPPYLIALSALHMSSVIHNNENAMKWFSELTISIEKITQVSQQIIQLYELWRGFDEKKEIPGILFRMPRPRMSHSGSLSGSRCSTPSGMR
ncbi:hypothetical protein ACHWQZ_G013123 [Mnemiopsis leidyi]